MGDDEGRKYHDVPAHGDDPGFRFLFPVDGAANGSVADGGLIRKKDQGHTVAIVGRGGTGKTFLALQVITQILSRTRKLDRDWPEQRPHAAFYFTLEATPAELYRQLVQFEWGEPYQLSDGDAPAADADSWHHAGLYIVSIPSPARDLNALLLQVRQTVARELRKVGRVVAIGIDPLGGIELKPDLRADLSALKDLSTSHKTFLFLLSEDHVFDRHPSIEHYSHSVIHLKHDPRTEPYRRLYVQKSRGQRFRSGYHHVKIDPEHGVRIFPSVQAQSAYAHDLLMPRRRRAPSLAVQPDRAERLFWSDSDEEEGYPEEQIEPGSVAFLMGPPGTFKQFHASRFARATTGEKAKLYISFKAEFEAVEAAAGEEVVPLDEVRDSAKDGRSAPPDRRTHFFDARNPLLTPEEVLSRVREAVVGRETYGRAVVWGLRRLNDMPNFAGRHAVQFLEALVTLLKCRSITSLLVDWPDIEKASTLPIVDLSQYILLTRVCRGLEGLELDGPDWERMSPATRDEFQKLWSPRGKWNHISFLRIQRTARGFHRDKGRAFRRSTRSAPDAYTIEPSTFEPLWLGAGVKWEQDPGLVH